MIFIFTDLIHKIEERTPCHVKYVESEDFCGIKIFRLGNCWIGKFGFRDGNLEMAVNNGKFVFRTRNLCEPGDPIEIIIKFMKRNILTMAERDNWNLHDMYGGNKA